MTESYADFYRRSLEDRDGFWSEQAKLVAERVHARIREPLTLAALNTPIERAAMACLAAVLRDGVAPHGPSLHAAVVQTVQAESRAAHAVTMAADGGSVRMQSAEQGLSATMDARGLKLRQRSV